MDYAINCKLLKVEFSKRFVACKVCVNFNRDETSILAGSLFSPTYTKTPSRRGEERGWTTKKIPYSAITKPSINQHNIIRYIMIIVAMGPSILRHAIGHIPHTTDLHGTDALAKIPRKTLNHIPLFQVCSPSLTNTKYAPAKTRTIKKLYL